MSEATFRKNDFKRPTSVEDFAFAIRAARDAGSAIQLAGAGSLPLTCFPDASRPLQTLSTLRLNKAIEHAVSDMTVIVQAGISLEALQRQLAWHNQWLPVDPPAIAPRSPGQRTIGGLIASNSLGPLRFGGGAANGGGGDWRLLIMGMKWIDASGTLITGGGRTVKNVAGYSSPRMLIGSCGALGAIVEVTLRTFARPADEQCVILFCSDPTKAERLLASIMLAPLTPSYLQLIGARTFAANPLGLPSPPGADGSGMGGGMALVAGFLGKPETCTAQIEALRQLPEARSIESIAQTVAQAGRLRLWMTTEPAIPTTVLANASTHIGLRLFVRSSRVAALVAALEAISRSSESVAGDSWVVSEAGTGVIRAVVRATPEVLRLMAEVDASLLTQGTLAVPSGERPHGIDRLKGALDPSFIFGFVPYWLSRANA